MKAKTRGEEIKRSGEKLGAHCCCCCGMNAKWLLCRPNCLYQTSEDSANWFFVLSVRQLQSNTSIEVASQAATISWFVKRKKNFNTHLFTKNNGTAQSVRKFSRKINFSELFDKKHKKSILKWNGWNRNCKFSTTASINKQRKSLKN